MCEVECGCGCVCVCLCDMWRIILFAESSDCDDELEQGH